MPNSIIFLNKKKISLVNKPYIIAEIGSNFNQNFVKAKKLILKAKYCGVDAVKFQLFKSEKLYPDDKKMYRIFKSIELNPKWIPKLKKFAEKCKLDFLCSCFDLESAKILCNHNLRIHKIASSEIENYDLSRYLIKTKKTIEQLAGVSFQEILDDFFYGTKPFESILVDTFEYLGLELIHKPSPKYSYAKLGFKTIPQGQNFVVKAIYPGSPAEMGGLMLEDEIIGVNSYMCNGELDKWLNYFDDEIKVLTLNRRGKLHEISFPTAVRHFYLDYSVKQVENPNQHQKRAFAKFIS
jgi:hypothetical protein